MSFLEEAQKYDEEHLLQRNKPSQLPEGQAVRLYATIFTDVFPSHAFPRLDSQLSSWFSLFLTESKTPRPYGHVIDEGLLRWGGDRLLGYIVPEQRRKSWLWSRLDPFLFLELPQKVAAIELYASRVLPSIALVTSVVFWTRALSQELEKILTCAYRTKFVPITAGGRGEAWTEVGAEQQRRADVQKLLSEAQSEVEGLISQYFSGVLSGNADGHARTCLPSVHVTSLKRMDDLQPNSLSQWVEQNLTFLQNFGDMVFSRSIYYSDGYAVLTDRFRSSDKRGRLSFLVLGSEPTLTKKAATGNFDLEYELNSGTRYQLRTIAEMLAVRRYLEVEGDRIVHFDSLLRFDTSQLKELKALSAEAQRQIEFNSEFSDFRVRLNRLLFELQEQPSIAFWLQDRPELKRLDTWNTEREEGLFDGLKSGLRYLARRAQERLSLVTEKQRSVASLRESAINYSLASSNVALQKSIRLLTVVLVGFAMLQILLLIPPSDRYLIFDWLQSLITR